MPDNEHNRTNHSVQIVVLFPTQDAPHYKYGYQFLIAFGLLAVGGMYLLDYLHKWDRYCSPLPDQF